MPTLVQIGFCYFQLKGFQSMQSWMKQSMWINKNCRNIKYNDHSHKISWHPPPRLITMRKISARETKSRQCHMESFAEYDYTHGVSSICTS